MHLLPGLAAVGTKVIDGMRKKLTTPFAFENRFGRLGRNIMVVDGFEFHAATALLTMVCGVLVGGIALHRHAEIGAEGSFGGIESREEVSLQGRCEESLGQVLGVFVGLLEFEADESIDRLPVEGDDLVHRVAGQSRFSRLEEREVGGWKLCRSTAYGCVCVQPAPRRNNIPGQEGGVISGAFQANRACASGGPSLRLKCGSVQMTPGSSRGGGKKAGVERLPFASLRAGGAEPSTALMPGYGV